MFDSLKKKIKEMFTSQNTGEKSLLDHTLLNKKVNIEMNRVLTEFDSGLCVAVALKKINKKIVFYSTKDQSKLCAKIHMPFKLINNFSTNFPSNSVIEVEKITQSIVDSIKPTEILTKNENEFSTGLISHASTPHKNTKIIKLTISCFDGFVLSEKTSIKIQNRIKKNNRKTNITPSLNEDQMFEKINSDNITMFDFEQIINTVLSQKKSLISSLAALNMGNTGEILKSVEQMQIILKAMTIKEKKDHTLLYDNSRVNRITQNNPNQKLILEKFIENWPNLKNQFRQMLNMFSQFKNNPAKMMEMLKNFKR